MPPLLREALVRHYGILGKDLMWIKTYRKLFFQIKERTSCLCILYIDDNEPTNILYISNEQTKGENNNIGEKGLIE